MSKRISIALLFDFDTEMNRAAECSDKVKTYVLPVGASLQLIASVSVALEPSSRLAWLER